MKWLSFPTWFLTLLMGPLLPKTHPWKGRYFPMQDWADCQTPLCKQLDWGLWISGAVAILSVWVYVS